MLLLQVDISFSNDSGPRSAQLMLEYMNDMPPLRPMVLLFKYFLVSILPSLPSLIHPLANPNPSAILLTHPISMLSISANVI